MVIKMITQIVDNISFHMKESHDFSFLSKYGKVFCVFDQNDSGNISFGVSDEKIKYFIKVAGAKTANYDRDTMEAVEVLKNATSLYDILKQSSLIQLVEHFEHEGLYIVVFKWAEGDCLFDYWNFGKYANDPLLQSPRSRYKQLPIDKRLKSVRSMFEFLVHTERMGYVAVDFYDGSIMYDFINDTTTICDIDFFRKKPTYNNMGADFWGTKRLKAPEEYIYGAVIDEVTNIFTLGAMIFHFFGKYSESDIGRMYENNSFFPCTEEKWDLSKELYAVALKAVNEDRSKRYISMTDFFRAWVYRLCG
jgi:serine/threonine protein kinase